MICPYDLYVDAFRALKESVARGDRAAVRRLCEEVLRMDGEHVRAASNALHDVGNHLPLRSRECLCPLGHRAACAREECEGLDPPSVTRAG